MLPSKQPTALQPPDCPVVLQAVRGKFPTSGRGPLPARGGQRDKQTATGVSRWPVISVVRTRDNTPPDMNTKSALASPGGCAQEPGRLVHYQVQHLVRVLDAGQAVGDLVEGVRAFSFLLQFRQKLILRFFLVSHNS